MSKRVPVLTFYLEMLKAPESFISPPDRKLHILQSENPSTDFYLYIYNRVGSQYNWVDRNIMSREELKEIICSEGVEIHVLYESGSPAGFVELDFRTEGVCELAYFGLLPEYTGFGLGKYFLGWAIRKAWSKEINRLWVHTCELDHPAALSTYQKAGFCLYDEKQVMQEMPD
ncbi:MAG: GNAT family N-acetyltransferase [Bacteroidota bacterium]